eukprot:9436481-Pyramimonas_sp.AAC.1
MLYPAGSQHCAAKVRPPCGASKKGERMRCSTLHADAVATVGGSQSAQYAERMFTDITTLPWIRLTRTSMTQGFLQRQGNGLDRRASGNWNILVRLRSAPSGTQTGTSRYYSKAIYLFSSWRSSTWFRGESVPPAYGPHGFGWFDAGWRFPMLM